MNRQIRYLRGPALTLLILASAEVHAGDTATCLKILDSIKMQSQYDTPVKETTESEIDGKVTLTEQIFFGDEVYAKGRLTGWTKSPNPKNPPPTDDFLQTLASPLVKCSEVDLRKVPRDGTKISEVDFYIGDHLAQQILVTAEVSSGRPITSTISWFVAESGGLLPRPYHFVSTWSYRDVQVPEVHDVKVP